MVRVLSPHNRESLPLQGREELLTPLKAWLETQDRVSVQALVGGGGRGKTRLAAELAAWARAQGWTAGFARRDDLDVFQSAGCRTVWDGPCLVVVDYAAAKRAELGAWLRSLAHVEEECPPLRLLLLERTGGAGAAWWGGLFDQPGTEGEAIREMLGRGAPLTVDALSDPDERHAVFAAAFGQATDAAVPARNAWLDQALLEASLGGEPLFLAMFGLVAAQQGLAATQALAADQIALELARQELKRIGKHWAASGFLPAAERPLHAHLAAVASLCEGLTEAEAHAAIARESAALHQAIPEDQTEQARAALHAALPGELSGVAAIIPDILGEAVAIEAFRALPDAGVEAVQRAAQVNRGAVTRVVVRACQDFLIRGQRAPLAWLKTLQADAVELEALLELVNAMPAETTELRELALELAEEILRRLPLDEERAPLLLISTRN